MAIGQRAQEQNIWSVSNLDSLPIPEFFNCCSLNHTTEAKVGIDKKYSMDNSGKEKGKWDTRRPLDVSQRNSYHRNKESNSYVGIQSPDQIPHKQIGKSLSASAARKLLQEMGVEEDSQPELHNYNGNEFNPHSSLPGLRSPQNPRVLVFAISSFSDIMCQSTISPSRI